MWAAPIEILTIAAILWSEVGPTALTGFAVFLCVIPLQFIIGKLSGKMRSKTAAKTDNRARLMNDIISGIKVIKMYCWENAFEKLIQEARQYVH